MSTLEHQRPRLLAHNRKLRHLKGISLRNLSFAPSQLRTTDDGAIQHKSSGKLEVLKESGTLHPSRSSGNLRRDSLLAGADPKPRPQQTRRTSLSFAHTSPGVRQKKLEEFVDSNTGDVFFTLHVDDTAEPVYISEVREKSANFNFQFFNLSEHASTVTRACKLIIRVWSRRPRQPLWTFLLEELIDLRRLNFIGTLLERQYPPNALVFHLEDGLYSLDFPTRAAEPRQAPPTATSSYNALMKLANLENSIEDAIETQREIMQQINDILERAPEHDAGAATEEVVLANKYVATQRRSNRQAEKRRDDLKESLRCRRAAIATGRAQQSKAEGDITSGREKLKSSRELVDNIEQQIRGQRRRICSELCDIFPITPIPNAPPLSFAICNIPIPNSVYDAATAKTLNEDVLSAGLGFMALLTGHLQYYLSHPLPYNIVHYGSRSFVKDEISQLQDKQVGRRDFPLFLPRGGSTTGKWRFEYAWFLLNKNIETLCSSQGLRVVDIRHSLANLKYLLYVCSAGTDEVPERKKGGVRGLWVGRLKGRLSALSPLFEGEAGNGSSAGGSTASSRPGSADSEAHMTSKGSGGRSEAAMNGSSNGRGLDSIDKSASLALPFSDADRFTLRTKGLRENAAR